MTRVEGSLRKAVKEGLPDQCRKAHAGSAWAALLVAIRVKPVSLDELMRAVGLENRLLRSEHTGFDACADAYAIYKDALVNGEEL